MQRFVLDICANLLKTYRFLPIANMSTFNAGIYQLRQVNIMEPLVQTY